MIVVIIGVILLLICLEIVTNYFLYLLLEYEDTIFKIFGYVIGNIILSSFILLIIGICVS